MTKAAFAGAGALALMLGGCGETAPKNAVEAPANVAEANTSAQPSVNTASEQMPAAAVAPAANAITGMFEAVSNTAMSVTGDVTIAADKLGFGLDQSYATGAGTTTTAADAYAGSDSWADLLGVTPDTVIEIRPVTSEQVGTKARNGGLCGKAKTSFVALARKAAGTPDELLQIAAFQGAAAPGKGAAADNLCGTFTYMPKTGVWTPPARQ